MAHAWRTLAAQASRTTVVLPLTTPRLLFRDMVRCVVKSSKASQVPDADESLLPALYIAADRASLDAQRNTRWRAGTYLGLLVLAAAGGAIDVPIRDDRYNLGGVVAFGAFLVALLVGLSNVSAATDERWYEGRATAESLKTMAFRFAVRGDPFQDGDVECLFLDRLRQVLGRLQHLALPAVDADQVTDEMVRVRQLPLRQRQSYYAERRIEQQRQWYVDKSNEHSKSARWLAILAVVATLIGLVFGFLRATNEANWDLLGVLAAAAASLRAWSDLRQHRTNASAYSLAAQELGIAKAEMRQLDDVDEARWARFVSDTEDAISREHVMWLARRSKVVGSKA